MLELIPCIYPTCEDSGKPVASLVIKGPKFTSVAWHPADHSVMSLTADWLGSDEAPNAGKGNES